MKRKGYIGQTWFNANAGVIRGLVIEIKDVITFQGATVAEARVSFVESVEDNLASCVERGEEPE